MLKVKGHYYTLWKTARAIKERVALVRRNPDKAVDIERYRDNPGLMEFLAWCQDQDDATLALDIITLRRMFLTR